MIEENPPLPMVFKIVANSVVQAVMDVLFRSQEAQHGMAWAAGERNLVFYADDERIAGWDHEWVQDALMTTVAMFRRMGLEDNLYKNKAMICTPGLIWGKWGRRHTSNRIQVRDQPTESGIRHG